MVDKMLQFKRSAALCLGIPGGDSQSSTLFLPSRGLLLYSATNRITVFKTARRWTAPFRREEMNKRNERVCSTRAGRGRRSRRSEISFRMEVEFWLGNSRSSFVGLLPTVLTLAPAFFFGFPEASIVAAEDLGSVFLGQGVFLLVITFCNFGAFVIG